VCVCVCGVLSESEKEAMLKLGCESWYAAGTMARGEGERVRDDGSLCEKVRHESAQRNRETEGEGRARERERERERGGENLP